METRIKNYCNYLLENNDVFDGVRCLLGLIFGIAGILLILYFLCAVFTFIIIFNGNQETFVETLKLAFTFGGMI